MVPKQHVDIKTISFTLLHPKERQTYRHMHTYPVIGIFEQQVNLSYLSSAVQPSDFFWRDIKSRREWGDCSLVAAH